MRNQALDEKDDTKIRNDELVEADHPDHPQAKKQSITSKPTQLQG